ncbi:hypothetical protein K491DRAFT_678026 [Lophiostoma macrostomum CBS 122681]|uniref:Putative zinc-finger domain-containing protein n=1 Tax=Lophiostoma macrostomum CBS 122681 TaxID=1314788 RepID=A0A6A6T9C7_9PLEO|nr:hypothetical protein K491DRAFT_678026 [Lophiostoma macrostomum CBS 122681]
MADYSHPPPFGMPFPIPPQFLQQPQHGTPNAQPNNVAMPSDARQAPFTDAFQFNGSIPGLNLQSYNQNAQQAPYQQWPQAPPPQHQEHFQPQQQYPYGSLQFPQFLGQNGMPIPPPPPVGTGFFPPPTQQQPTQAVPASHASSAQAPPSFQVKPQFLDAANNRLSGSLFGDKEDGEVSEADRMSKSPAVNGQPMAAPHSAPHAPQRIPKGSHSANARDAPGAQNGIPSGGGNPTLQQLQGKSTSHPQTVLPRNMHNMSFHREEAKRFVKILYDHNIGYPALSREGIDSELLNDMYCDLKISLHTAVGLVTTTTPHVEGGAVLPVAGAFQPPPRPANGAESILQASQSKALPANGAESTLQASQSKALPANGAENNTQGLQSKPQPQPAVKTNVNPPPPRNAAPSPVDRKDYIARLQAARKGKQPVVDKVTPPQYTPPATVPAPPAVKDELPAPPTAKLVASDAVSEATEDEKAERSRKQTELLRQRLEMMKALGKVSSSPATPQATTVISEPALQNLELSSPSQQNGSRALALPATVGLSGPLSAPVSPFSKLPGLFMNSSTTTIAQTPPANASNGTSTSSRKRPVASDFDEVTTPRSSGPAYTRPLGESPHEHHHEQMIIDVSEEDSAGSDMDVDEEDTAPQVVTRPTQSFRGPHGALQRVASLPSTSNIPSGATSVRASPVVSTPPASRTPAAKQRLDDIERQKKELEMKLRIREAMQKKKAAQIRKDDIASSTAISLDQNKESGQKVALKPVPVPSATLSMQSDPIPTGSRLGAEKTSDAWRKQRRIQVEDDIRIINASLADAAARFSQIEVEKTELEIKTQRLHQNKEDLVRELETLSIQTESIPVEELRAKASETDLRTNNLINHQSQSVPSPIKVVDEANIALGELKQQMITESTPDLESRPSSTQPPTNLPPIATSIVQKKPASNQTEPLRPAEPNAVLVKVPEHEEPGRLPTSTARVETEGPATTTELATPVDDEEDFYSPAPVTAPVSDDPAEVNISVREPGKSPSEEGEVEMSESSSSEEGEVYDPEDYTPQHVQPVTASNLEPPENEAMDIASTPLASPSPSTTEDEGEIYEPPETDLEMPDARANDDGALVTTAQQPTVEDLGAMDTDSSSSYDSASPQESSSEPAQDMSAASIDVPKSLLTVADDLAPELQSQAAPTTHDPAAEPPTTTDDEVEAPRFVPYESPLRNFKSYRYSPNFPNDVAGGYLSLTYSHQIDPEKPLCPFEAVGGTCNDPQCSGQHFKGMGISGQYEDDSLVFTPSTPSPYNPPCTANPGKSPEERQRWVAGLRLVLKKLREDNIKDHNGIAVEIAKYRRQFFEDETRVVNM